MVLGSEKKGPKDNEGGVRDQEAQRNGGAREAGGGGVARGAEVDRVAGVDAAEVVEEGADRARGLFLPNGIEMAPLPSGCLAS